MEWASRILRRSKRTGRKSEEVKERKVGMDIAGCKPSSSEAVEAFWPEPRPPSGSLDPAAAGSAFNPLYAGGPCAFLIGREKCGLKN
jgi:hypothetical protein